MSYPLKILLITDEIWNDRVFGNNVLQNWFEGMPDIEIAQIGCIPVNPNNKVCRNYFRLTDMGMVKSIFGKRTGEILTYNPSENDSVAFNDSNPMKEKGIYRFFKKISGTPVRLLREMIWLTGRYDKKKLKAFIDDFNPDIVFCPRLLTWKLMRLEKTVAKMTDAPFVAFTADDESSFRQLNYSPLYWINRFFFHIAFKRHIKLYRHYFAFTKEQVKEYRENFGVETSVLMKCGQFPESFEGKTPGNPVRMVYAGRIYCNRWKTLAKIGEVLNQINKDGVKIVLDVYTQDKISSRQRKAFSKSEFLNIKPPVSPEELKNIYRKADIALHVESFDRKNRLKTRVSFSTKIIDLMASSCAIMAISWDEHSGYRYLKDNDAAFCVASYSELLPVLQKIADNPQIITDYQIKAYNCGKRNHSKELIQNQILTEFSAIVNSK